MYDKTAIMFSVFSHGAWFRYYEFCGDSSSWGNPFPVTVQDWIEAHPGSVICGEVEQYENTEFSQSVYLKKHI